MANEQLEFDKAELEFDKAIGQLRFSLNQVLKPLRLYGQGEYVTNATEEIISLAIQLYLKLSGIDEPYHINDLHW